MSSVWSAQQTGGQIFEMDEYSIIIDNRQSSLWITLVLLSLIRWLVRKFWIRRVNNVTRQKSAIAMRAQLVINIPVPPSTRKQVPLVPYAHKLRSWSPVTKGQWFSHSTHRKWWSYNCKNCFTSNPAHKTEISQCTSCNAGMPRTDTIKTHCSPTCNISRCG